jgi:hypothetical protein
VDSYWLTGLPVVFVCSFMTNTFPHQPTGSDDNHHQIPATPGLERVVLFSNLSLPNRRDRSSRFAAFFNRPRNFNPIVSRPSGRLAPRTYA